MAEILPSPEKGSVIETDLFVGDWEPIEQKGSVIETDLFKPVLHLKTPEGWIWADIDIKVDGSFEPSEADQLPL